MDFVSRLFSMRQLRSFGMGRHWSPMERFGEASMMHNSAYAEHDPVTDFGLLALEHSRYSLTC